VSDGRKQVISSYTTGIGGSSADGKKAGFEISHTREPLAKLMEG
jgi:hypothetical protein